MIKTKTKVSGGFTTLTGLNAFLAVRGYLDTLRKHTLNLLDHLTNTLTGHTWAPT